ncbi:hypothetical protein NPIL_146621 [Nephila pilipes]|uniref:Uncharacterized protein n=1 Tax=Nephila pilipes TaxID=299642 RepID=A0A8X6THP7_NEPPI|nr:hypothetical protein NPIL_146621 [Nephila pilipes]
MILEINTQCGGPMIKRENPAVDNLMNCFAEMTLEQTMGNGSDMGEMNLDTENDSIRNRIRICKDISKIETEIDTALKDHQQLITSIKPSGVL